MENSGNSNNKFYENVFFNMIVESVQFSPVSVPHFHHLQTCDHDLFRTNRRLTRNTDYLFHFS